MPHVHEKQDPRAELTSLDERSSRSDRGRTQDNVNSTHPTPTQLRAAAMNELFAALDNLLHSYRSMPDEEREDRLAADADLITGEIARRLAIARAAMSHTIPHRAAEGP
jgi:hypothetical protein